jgi:hypothetical protein
LRLPAELWNGIYGYVFSNFESGVRPFYFIDEGYYISIEDKDSDEHVEASNMLALTKTCRQLHAETWLLLFAMFEFYAEDYVESFLCFTRDLCEEQRHAISNVRLAIDDADFKLHSHLYDNGEEDSNHKTSVKTLPNFDTIMRSILQELPGVKMVVFEDWTEEGIVMKMVKGTEWEHLVRR